MSGPQLTESGKEKMIIEAALMCAQEPLKVSDLRKLFIEPVPDKQIMVSWIRCVQTGQSGDLNWLRSRKAGVFRARPRSGRSLTAYILRNRPNIPARYWKRLRLSLTGNPSRGAISKQSAASLSIPKRYDNSKNEDGSTSLASAIRLDIRRFMQPRRPF